MVVPMVLDGPVSRDAFQAYIDQVPIPKLKLGDIVFMGNLGGRTDAGVCAALDVAGARDG